MNIKQSVIIRIAASILFIYFGIQQLYNPSNWTGFIPTFLTSTSISAHNIVVMNGYLELTLGLFLLAGIYTKIAALILGIHLLAIVFSIGINPLGVRDLILAIATLSIYFTKPDKYTIDYKYNSKAQR